MNEHTSSIKWIPTKEKLPKKDRVYLVTIRIANGKSCVVAAQYHLAHEYSWGETQPAYWDDPSGEYDYTLDEAIAWAYMPEPYKEDI